MQAELFIPGRMPCMNDIVAWRASRNRGLYSKHKRHWHQVVAAAVEEQDVPRFPEGAYFQIVLREPNKRRDPDGLVAGCAKFLMDGLQHAGVLVNDGWSGVLGLSPTWEVDKRAPGVLVRMSDKPF